MTISEALGKTWMYGLYDRIEQALEDEFCNPQFDVETVTESRVALEYVRQYCRSDDWYRAHLHDARAVITWIEAHPDEEEPWPAFEQKSSYSMEGGDGDAPQV